MLNQLHKTHFGIEKTKNRARKLMYWSGLSVDIEKFIAKCSVCTKYSSNKVKEPLICHEVPNLPFEVVASDILDYGGESYLVLVDYLSNWIKLHKLKNKSIDEVLRCLRVIFSSHGLPLKFISDNVPYNCSSFRKFCENYGIAYEFSSPRYPQSNGLAEKAVHIAKQMLRKCQNEEDLFYFLLEYRTTPLCGLNKSPAEILNSRLLRTNLPVSKELLKPKVVDVYEKKIAKQQIVKNNYDKNAKSGLAFNKGDNVVMKVKKDNCWERGKVVDVYKTPRSYIVENQKGNQYRRNASFIKSSRALYKKENSLSESESEIRESDYTNAKSESNSTINPSIEDYCNDEAQAGSSSTTRSGRAIIKPSRYNDYYV